MSLSYKIMVILIMILTSCDLEQVVPYELPYEGDKLVVWSYIQPEETVEVTVYPTYEPLGLNTVRVIDNAIVELYENDVLVATLEHSENGVYTSSFYPTAEKSYHLKVSAPDFEEVVISEKVVVPLKPEIISINFIDSVNFPRNKIESFFDVMIGNDNHDFFEFREIYAGQDTTFLTTLKISPTTYYGDCTELSRVSDGIRIAKECLLNRDKIEFQFDYREDSKPDKVIFQFSNISSSYINFSLSLSNADIEQGFSFVSEPINVYTNMQGGYGLLAAYNPFIYEFEL